MREPSPQQQLDELLADDGYRKLLKALANNIAAGWGLSRQEARRYILSAIGEPTALASIHAAFVAAKPTGTYGLAAVISRRRVLDLLADDARREHHISLLAKDGVRSANDLVLDYDVAEDTSQQQINAMTRNAVACFGRQGNDQQRQADLLRRRILEETDYEDLSKELSCTENALRGRVFKAMRAFYRHIQRCHPEIESLRLAARARNV